MTKIFETVNPPSTEHFSSKNEERDKNYMEL